MPLLLALLSDSRARAQGHFFAAEPYALVLVSFLPNGRSKEQIASMDAELLLTLLSHESLQPFLQGLWVCYRLERGIRLDENPCGILFHGTLEDEDHLPGFSAHELMSTFDAVYL